MKEIEEINKLKSIKNIALAKDVIKTIPEIEGLYAFWWTGSIEDLSALNRNVTIQGKQLTKEERKNTNGKYKFHEIVWAWNLNESPVCLYVGKASNIQKRIKQHLLMNKPSVEWYSKHEIIRNGRRQDKHPDINDNTVIKRTSSCQFRAGLEHLYKNEKHLTLTERLKHIGISTIPNDNMKERFYLEDLAIGYFRPWFNLDSER